MSIRRTASLAFASLLALVACSGSPSHNADGILSDSGMAAALSAMRSQISTNSALRSGDCPSILSNTDDLKTVPSGESKTFTTSSCSVAASSDPSMVGQDCDVTLSVTSNGDGSAQQSNAGGVSTGSGDVYIFGFPSGPEAYEIVQDDNAQGAGCTQETLNAIYWGGSKTTPAFAPSGTGAFCVMTYVKSSTCGNVGLWKVSTGAGTVQ
jgi:hypothetical protein